MTGTADSLVLRCTGMDIKMLEMNIPAADQWLDIIVTTSPLTIREAKIKAAPMSVKGDTVVYHVSQYKEETDRAIADVLKRMPGITVEESGRIAYNGKPINRFYIEGMDMMGKCPEKQLHGFGQGWFKGLFCALRRGVCPYP